MVKTIRAFTLIELLVVIAIISILAAILFPVFASAREKARQAACESNEKEIATAAYMYMQDYDGALYHHHELYVLDDGNLVQNLPAPVAPVPGDDAPECDSQPGEQGNSQAEKPWAIFFQPYLKDRNAIFCPDDLAAHSTELATNLEEYNGDATMVGQECTSAPNGEQCTAEMQHTAMWSYLLNSIFTHKSCRYVEEGIFQNYATEAAINRLPDDNLIMFSERNSLALDAANNTTWGYVPQDDYDTWPGEANLVQNGTGPYANQGWVAYNRHTGGANYVFYDGHVKWMRWGTARTYQYPDHVVRFPLPNPPQ